LKRGKGRLPNTISNVAAGFSLRLMRMAYDVDCAMKVVISSKISGKWGKVDSIILLSWRCL
jgi:hypothetical protein